MNTWLSSACDALGVHFNNHFNISWERGELFGPDGHHPNKAGVQMQSPSLEYLILCSCAPHRNQPGHPATFMTVNDQFIKRLVFLKHQSLFSSTFSTNIFFIFFIRLRPDTDISNIPVIVTYRCPMRFAVKKIWCMSLEPNSSLLLMFSLKIT